MDCTEEFSLLGSDVWPVIVANCSRLTCRVLLLTCKSFGQLLPKKKYPGELLTTLAARENYLPLFQFFYNPLISIDTYRQAAKTGNLAILQILWQKQAFHPLQIEKVCFHAAMYNQRHVLDWLYSFLILEPFLVFKIAQGAVVGKHVHLLDWLEAREADFAALKNEEKSTLASVAAYRGSLDCLLWLWRRGHIISFREEATYGADLETSRWLVKNHFFSKEEMCLGAPNVHCVKYNPSAAIRKLEEFYEPGKTYGITACNRAAMSKSLPVMKWLRKHNFPWTNLTCARAARRGTPEILRYCLRKGCPVKKEKLTRYAIESNNFPVLVWLRNPTDKYEQKFAEPFPWADETLLSGCASQEILDYLLENDYPRHLWEHTVTYLQGEFKEESIYAQKCCELRQWILDQLQ